MTDDTETEQPKGPLSVFTCINRRHPSRSCYALIENTREVRQQHRQWHVDQETDREALRGGIKARDETIALLRQEIAGYGRDVKHLDETVQSFHGEVQRVETPIVPPPLEIDRNGYSDDELDDEPDEARGDAHDGYPEGFDEDVTESAYAGEPAESGADEDDDTDDDDDLHTVARPSSPVWAR